MIYMTYIYLFTESSKHKNLYVSNIRNENEAYSIKI